MRHDLMPAHQFAEVKFALVNEDRPGFASLLTESPNQIDCLPFSHMHASIHDFYCGIAIASFRSTGNQSIPDLKETELLHGAPKALDCIVAMVEGVIRDPLYRSCLG